MATNISVTATVGVRPVDYRVIIVQVLVILFLSINMSLIVTFFRTESFHTSTRYLLFALTLWSDSFLLVISDMQLVSQFFKLTIQVWACVIVSVIVLVYSIVTPVTLAAMTLERYVAVCMPLRHAELCSTRSTVHCILIIHTVSSFPCIVKLCVFFADAPLSFYHKYVVCTVEIFNLFPWHNHLRSAISYLFFLVICIIIVFCYCKIMIVAKAASGENKKSSQKGLKTVSLHGFQLLLSLIQLLCPFIETAVLQIDFNLFIAVRYSNYILFVLAPRCLNPLIYGLRDETFFLSLKKLCRCWTAPRDNNLT